ncbi:MAG: hypothetical protein U9R38_02050 [Candidatus Margulisiibacteriota bacterium]|nr:hypothetical protein [Candidatus Margulisiibacteriota bacterium]
MKYRSGYNLFVFLRHALSVPIIWSLIIPFLILDLWLEIYHRTCFPLYRIPYVPRRKYIKIDRHKLQYLSWLEKTFCMYCGYVNEVIHYVTEVAARTEEYWCGVMHKKDDQFIPPPHHLEKGFVDYGEEKALLERFKRK